MAVEIGCQQVKNAVGSISERRETFLTVESLFVVFRGLGLMLAEKKTPRPFAMRFFVAMWQLILADRKSRAEEEEEVF